MVEIRPLGCRESAGSNLARSDEPLHSLPIQGGSANRRVDQIHLSLFTAVCVPVQRSGSVPVISPCRTERSDYEYFTTPCLTFPDESSCLYYETLPPSRTRDRGFVGDTVREMEAAADWASLSDEDLLERRISKLSLTLETTPLEPLIQQLYAELSTKGLAFHPPTHIGDEWFVPIGIPAIFVPFFLVHDRLRALERSMMLEVEGETPEWFMKLMRHEAGHAYMYAYRLTRKKSGRKCSGKRRTKRRRVFIGRARSAAVT